MNGLCGQVDDDRATAVSNLQIVREEVDLEYEDLKAGQNHVLSFSRCLPDPRILCRFLDVYANSSALHYVLALLVWALH